MAGASIIVRGLSQALRALDNTKRASMLGKIIGQLVTAGVKSNFVKGVDPDTGQKWAPIKNRKGQPLRDKGGLMRSIHPEISGTGFSSKISVGTNLIYAATHQFGDPNRVPKDAKRLAFKVFGVTVFAKKVSIPQRRFLPTTQVGLDRTTAGRLQPAIDKYLQSQWK